MAERALSSFAGALVVFVAVGACAPPAAQETEPQQVSATPPPDLIVVSLCSVRPDHMSLYGYPRETTPNLAELANDSIVFDHAVTPWPKTTPAFAALVTGLYAHDTGVMRITPGQRLDDSQLTLAEILRDSGYDTAAFLSTGALNHGTNVFQQGFDRIEETFRLGQPFTATTDLALDWIRRERDRPYFAWVHYNNAHQPYYAPNAPADLFVDDPFYSTAERVELNDGAPLDLPVPADHPARLQILRPDMGGVRPAAVLLERPTELGFYVARYDAGVFGADRMIGDLLAGLRTDGLLDRAILIVVGDHGESLGDHGYYFGHGRLPYDATARVPLLVRPPGGVAAQRVARPVSTLGLVPSVLELTGVDGPETAVPSLLAEVHRNGEEELVFSEAGYSFDYPLSVRDGRWKLIFVPNEVDRRLMRGARFELYDLRNDPEELDDRYQEEPEVARRLRGALARWARPWLERAYAMPPSEIEIVDEETRRSLEAMGYL